MKYQPLIHQVAVVLIGNFNPAIFSPAWLALNELVDKDDLEDAEVAVIHADITEFTIANFQLHAESERFSLSSSKEPFIKLSDIVFRMFSEFLPHTPIRQVGINYTIHFALKTTEQRHALGRALAPIAPWGPWGKTLEIDERGRSGGMRNLVMEEAGPPRRKNGYRRVHLEPSVRQDLVDPRLGVYMLVNDHFEVPDEDSGKSAKAAMEWMNANFDISLEESRAIISDLMDFADTL